MVKKKECYTKKTKTGKNYTTCVEGQKKPKRKRRTKAQMAAARAMAAQDKPAPKAKAKAKAKPKKTAPKKLSAGMSVLLTQSGFMAKMGRYAIPKVEREKRGRIAEKELDRMFNTLTNKNEVLFHNNITANYSSISSLKRTIKGREKVLERYKKKTENYKLIMRKKYKSPRQRGRFGSETAFRSDGVRMLETIIRALKQRLKERLKK